MTKKTWSAPVVTELSIAATLGGTVKNREENFIVEFNDGTPDAFGSIPTGSR